jgi:leucyl aminopeptidase
MKVTVVQGRLSEQKADAWIIYSFEDKPLFPESADAISRRLARMTEGWVKTTGFRGRPAEVTAFPSWESLPARFVILAGLGKKGDFHVGRLDRATAAASRTCRKLGLPRLALSLAPFQDLPFLSLDAAARTMVISVKRGQYDFVRYISRSDRRRKGGELDLTLADAGRGVPAIRAAVAEGKTVAEVESEVRDLANLPGNEAPPRVIAEAARAFARRCNLSCSVMDKGQLRRARCNALLAVAAGSGQDACLITLKYRGTRPNLRPIVLVGKTITFDTGGISLKQAKNMEWMKYDKCGGMAVLTVMLLAARLRFRHPVIGLLAAAENMPGGRATRPGDIVRARSGKAIEIVNTDAEGRLVLADAFSVAADFKPEYMVDLATLTGAVIVALGHTFSAVMGNDLKLVEQLRAAGDLCGDRLWPLPLVPEYAEGLRTPFADLKNVAGDGAAGTLVGGAFLQQFVPEGTSWAHVDIAGTAWEEKEQPYGPAGATLFGARLLVEWIQHLERKSS